MEQNLRLIKRVSKCKLKKDFDEKYDLIRKIALEKFNYDGEIKIIKDKKWVLFYIIEDIDRLG